MAELTLKKHSNSLTQLAWKRLKRNRLAMMGLTIICISILVALLGALIRPDNSPMANDMMLQLTTQKPGFSVKMLRVKKNAEEHSPGLFGMMLFGGKESEYKSIPISSYRFEDEYLVIEEYSNSKNRKGEIKKFNIADVVYPLSLTNSVKKVNGQLDFYTINGEHIVKPISELQKEAENNIGTRKFILGTDRFGRDLLSRLMAGTLVSLSVGFISVFISIIIGTAIGSIGGFFRGKVDDVIIWVINVVWSIPTLLLVIAITLALGKGFWQIFVAVGLTMWVEVARVVRGQFISLREKEFVEAGKALGFTDFRIIFRHVLPNVMGPIIVISASDFASAIIMEAGLSFLGIGAQPPMPSWGSMIKDHYGYIIVDAAYLAILPGLAIMVMVLSFILVGNGLRDSLDAKYISKN